ncbi:TraB/GumN family protein [Bacillus mangrovi]|uniref:TraB/GumN family protein n=1 Tax=Metabacillus mangrovi TaxID=1491830 RepID=A0A7X2V6E9_9BACI|nr:TraB/GumN family protein [Metabacillus mangrovi]MTH55797.1 TraB/GumN family protein [Metabacillus mangrovi]
MMKQLTGMCLLFILLLAAGCSGIKSESVEVPGQEDKQKESEKDNNYEGGGGFLWKVVHGETTMYVQGTTHLGHEDFYPLAPEIEEAYESSDVILPEVNMFEAETDEEEMNKIAMFGDATTLKDVVSEKSYARLSEIFKENQLAVEDYNSFQPWFVEGLLAQISVKKSEVAPEHGVDLYFLKRSLEDKKEIVELESIETQNQMLSNFSMETQVRMLENSIKSHDEVAASLNQIGYNWIKGKEDAFTDQLSEGFMENGQEYKQAMIDTRNRNMANKLDDILRENDGQTYFAIIGSAHVLLDPSVPDELEEKGYKIKRIY